MSFDIIESIIVSAANPGEAVKNIKLALGGTRIYIPAPENTDRNKQIREAFRGNNHREVCEMYDISMSTLWRIIRVRQKINSMEVV